MCGIAGIVSLNKKAVEISSLKEMTDVIHHRGPDGEGYWINPAGCAGFGHRRLSIIDLSDAGKQPMHYANGRYTITFNGEIYNYIELRAALSKAGYVFQSETDTEVLMAIYDEKKEKCLNELEGMFAFAIWDEKEQVLFCARDRFGEKPFHYYIDQDRFVFASEIKQFWAAGVKKQMDEAWLKRYAETGIIEDPKNITATFYKNIKKLDASHYLRLGPDGRSGIVNYWSISTDQKKFNGTIEQAAEKFLELFTKSIHLRLRSDVPVGSSLSGGLDSSSIVMLIDLLKGKEVKQNTFSARFKNFAKDEGKFIEAVVQKCKNVEVHYTWPDRDYFAEVFDKVTFHQDEPFSSTSIIAQYAVMQLAKEHQVTVLLDGQGADEALAGYLPYYSLYLDQLQATNRALFEKEFEAYNKFHASAFSYNSSAKNETVRMKLGRYRRKLLGQNDYFSAMLQNRLMNDTSHCGLKELLRYADRNSMAHSREVRLPFLSHELVEFIFSLPDSYKLNNGWTKFILRKAMSPILPEAICWRVDKIGYEPPQSDWLNGDLFRKKIKIAADALSIPAEEKQSANLFTRDWRLLMASQYM